MKVIFENKQKGIVDRFETDYFAIPFNKDYNIGFFLDGQDIELEYNEDEYSGFKNGISFILKYLVRDNEIIVRSQIKNCTDKKILVDELGLRLGIDCYMSKYPEWNDKFFPTLHRCEKTHFWGYFMSPEKKSFAIAVTSPVSSYHYLYNMAGEDYGHRIYTTCIDFFKSGKLPSRHTQMTHLEPEKKYLYDLHIIPLEDISDLKNTISQMTGIPVIASDKYTLEMGEKLEFDVMCDIDYSCKILSPDGKIFHKEQELGEYGLYTLEVSTERFISTAYFYCRKPWDFYLKAAREQSISKQQKATTHCESWYGFFSGFLAAKHYPDLELDKQTDRAFHEILELFLDIENASPNTAPGRIQNISAIVSLLVDKYECNPAQNLKYLLLASRMGDYLVKAQTADGAYRNQSTHYTCVIYIAKSIMELIEAEENSQNQELIEKSKEHAVSVKAAIDDLVNNLDRIGTEGEHTLEDGMISCSALQIADFALKLPEKERAEYIKAAEYMIDIHSCLEQNEIPDARVNGCSLRFWEAQYDVLIKANFMNSPHGWTAWTVYAKFYLYLLTGKIKYLKEAINSLGACVQLVDLNGNLRWAFAVDPQITCRKWIKDENVTVEDGYTSTKFETPAYAGKFEIATFGEEYIDMISQWFRTGKQRITGGYDHCPFIDVNNEFIKVDNQGGCCDNDVHEIFKCMEEFVLGRAFVSKEDNGKYYCVSCKVEDGCIYLSDDTMWLHLNVGKDKSFKVICGETRIDITSSSAQEWIKIR